MRTKAQIDMDIEQGNIDYTHEEWHMYNNIPKTDCAQCSQTPEALAKAQAKLLKPCCRQCYDGEHTRVKYCSCLCHEDEMAD